MEGQEESGERQGANPTPYCWWLPAQQAGPGPAGDVENHTAHGWEPGLRHCPALAFCDYEAVLSFVLSGKPEFSSKWQDFFSPTEL